MARTIPLLASALLVIVFALGCGQRGERPRCPQCGMYADLSEQWMSGATAASGEALYFDSPKCLLRFLTANPDARDPWWPEYYSQARSGRGALVFVRGSDLIGPMGDDLVPVSAEGDAAAQFIRDHGGEVVQPAAVDAALLEALR